MNFPPGTWAERSYYSKFMFLVAAVIAGMGILSLIGGLVAWAVTGINVLQDPALLSQPEQPGVLYALRIIQIFTSIGVFLLPALFMAYMVSAQPASYLSSDKKPILIHLILGILFLFLAQPFMAWMIHWNEGMHLPDSMAGVEQWMKDSEGKAGVLMNAFLAGDRLSDLLLNLFMIAVIPAIAEEFLFRGFIQKLFKEWLGNIHVAIFLSAFIFSAIHMQFFGFLPRLFLGMIFGYFMVWSGSIWVPVIAHFLNNASAVILYFLVARGTVQGDPETLGSGPEYFWMVLPSVVIGGGILYLFHRRRALS